MTEKIPTKKQPVVIYAIRRPDGKYSRGGGIGPTWGPFPKTWGIGPLKNHLLQFKPCQHYRRAFPYVDCQVVRIQAADLSIIETYPAVQWAWDNCFVPYRDREVRDWRREEFLKAFEDWKVEYLNDK
jgi:hypothetical protein